MRDTYRRLVAEWRLAHDGWAGALAAAGSVVLVFVFGVGLLLADSAGKLFGRPRLAAAEAARIQGLLQAVPAWLTPVGLAGLTLLMVAVVVTLLRILRTIDLRREATVAALPVLWQRPAQEGVRHGGQ